MSLEPHKNATSERLKNVVEEGTTGARKPDNEEIYAQKTMFVVEILH